MLESITVQTITKTKSAGGINSNDRLQFNDEEYCRVFQGIAGQCKGKGSSHKTQ